MSSEPTISALDEGIIVRVITLVGFLLVASGSARSHVILSFLGEILIPSEIVFFLWSINVNLILWGVAEIIAAIQISRGKLESGGKLITVGLLMGAIMLAASAAQQIIRPLHFYDFVIPDLIGWIGIGLALLVRLKMK